MSSRGKLQVQMVLDQDKKERIARQNNLRSIQDAHRDLFFDSKQGSSPVTVNNLDIGGKQMDEQANFAQKNGQNIEVISIDFLEILSTENTEDNNSPQIHVDTEFSGNLICSETLEHSDDDQNVCREAISENFSKNGNQIVEAVLHEVSGSMMCSETVKDKPNTKEINNLFGNAPSELDNSDNLMRRCKEKNKSGAGLVNYSSSEDDFSSDDSVCDPLFEPLSEDPQSDITDSEEDQENELHVKTPTRWRKRDPSQWKVNIIKSKRSQCLPYYNKNKECPAKHPKVVNCTHCRFDCSFNFTEEDRIEICHKYWALADNKRQKDFIINSVKTVTPKHRKVDENSDKARAVSKIYYLQNNKGRFRVCSNFYQKTLCISNCPIDTAIRGFDSMGVFQGIDKRGRKIPGNKTTEQQLTFIKQHIESFPAMESHYVRQSSKKKYLDSQLSILKMYELCTEFCKEKKYKPVSEFTYRRVFGTCYNLSFFKPKKDQCPTCNKYETADATKKTELELDYTMHVIRKNECNSAKDADKKRGFDDPSFITTNFDLQSVLQLPYSDVSQFYYSRKICVYNLTLYQGDGTNVYCYFWKMGEMATQCEPITRPTLGVPTHK